MAVVATAATRGAHASFPAPGARAGGATASPAKALPLWILVVYGATLIVTESKLWAPVRAWADARVRWLGTLLGCPMCFGWWCGAVLSLLGWSPSAATMPSWPRLLRAVTDGAAASAVAWACTALVSAVLEIRYSLETWRVSAEAREAAALDAEKPREPASVAPRTESP